ncbi:MAG: hypothetical protein WC967_12070 [Balneolaceae bacterium]
MAKKQDIVTCVGKGKPKLGAKSGTIIKRGGVEYARIDIGPKGEEIFSVLVDQNGYLAKIGRPTRIKGHRMIECNKIVYISYARYINNKNSTNYSAAQQSLEDNK